jgi:hypothetical protein
MPQNLSLKATLTGQTDVLQAYFPNLQCVLLPTTTAVIDFHRRPIGTLERKI